MERIALLFAGQGAQHPGMGADLVDASPAAAEVFAAAERVRSGTLGLCQNGSKEELARTENTQPCVFAHDLAAACALRERGLEPVACAGFSLGEVAALTFAGAFGATGGFELVCERARLMALAAARHPGAMRAVIKLDRERVVELAEQAGEECWAVNFNSPQQTVVAGSVDACNVLDGLVKEAGGRTMRVAVSGAFHSPYMAKASEGLAEHLDGAPGPQPTSIPVIANVTAEAYPSDAHEMAELLARQASEPVQWVRTLHELERRGIETFVEVGPGKTLAGLTRRTLAGARVMSCETAEDVARIANELA